MVSVMFDMYDTIFARKVLSGLPIGLCYVHNRTFLWVNEFMMKILGKSFDEIVAHNTRMIYDSDEEFERVGNELYVDKKGGGVITSIVRKDGKHIPVIIHAISEEVRITDGVFLAPHVITFSVLSDELAQLMGLEIPVFVKKLKDVDKK